MDSEITPDIDMYTDNEIASYSVSCLTDRNSYPDIKQCNAVCATRGLTSYQDSLCRSLQGSSDSDPFLFSVSQHPLTEDQLQRLFYNPELVANESFIDDFIKTCETVSSHVLFELLQSYCDKRLKLLTVEDTIRQSQVTCDSLNSRQWTIYQKSIAVNVQCADKHRVSCVHTYDHCELNDTTFCLLLGELESMREHLEGTHALYSYESVVHRLQVESHLDIKLFAPYSVWRRLYEDCASPGSRVQANDQHGRLICCLRQSLSVLFCFHRKLLTDQQFIDDVRRWTGSLVELFVNLASFQDHLFLLNHVLRCPAGVASWAAGFVQIAAPPTVKSSQLSLHSPALDHIVTCLATIMSPIRAREHFVRYMKVKNSDQPDAWTFADPVGDEDDDTSNCWMLLHEDDLLSVLRQLPLPAVFTHLLHATARDSGVVDYDIRCSTDKSMMRLFAFSSQWISLLGLGLQTYGLARYSQLNKHLGHLMAQTLGFAADHWNNFKSFLPLSVHGSSTTCLQMEFDELFLKATKTFLTAKRLGSWQFMLDLPFGSLSTAGAWRVFWLLEQGHCPAMLLKPLPHHLQCIQDLEDSASRAHLADILAKLPSPEYVLLLSSIVNMAVLCPDNAKGLVECITLHLLEVTYICKNTCDFCLKPGRFLLSDIVNRHSYVLSAILGRVADAVDDIGKVCLYLFSEIPIKAWIPQNTDMKLIKHWLLDFNLGTLQSQLACILMERFNWGIDDKSDVALLNVDINRQVAILLVEAYMKFIPENLSRVFIVEGIKQVASHISGSSQCHTEQQFSNWAWSLALRLRLHRQTTGNTPSTDTGPFVPLNLDAGDHVVLVTASRRGNPLACYLILSMTDIGHELTMFVRDGLDLLVKLTDGHHYAAVIRVMGCLVGQFLPLDSGRDFLLQSQMFHKLMEVVVTADDSLFRLTQRSLGVEYQPGIITKHLMLMVQNMVVTRLSTDGAIPVLMFWVEMVMKVSNYLSDRNCCYVLDCLVRWGYLLEGVDSRLLQLFRDYYVSFLEETKPRHGFLSWIRGNDFPLLTDRGVLGSFVWLSEIVLQIEQEATKDIWNSLHRELIGNIALSLDSAMKAVIGRMKPSFRHTVPRLSIYRWAGLAVDTPLRHSALPVIWQHFFALYLGRIHGQHQVGVDGGCVGHRFFQSPGTVSVLKQMKQRLNQAVDYHLNYNPDNDSYVGCDFPMDSSTNRGDGQPPVVGEKSFRSNLARYYETLLLWLEEPSLVQPGFYLNCLPRRCDYGRLQHIMTPEHDKWLDLLDLKRLQCELGNMSDGWLKVVSGRLQFSRHETELPDGRPRRPSDEQLSAQQRILGRLEKLDHPAQPPPPLHPPSSPVSRVCRQALFKKSATLSMIRSDLASMFSFNKEFYTHWLAICAVDAAYLELVPTLYSNVRRKATVSGRCRSLINPLHRCSGPAVSTVTVKTCEIHYNVKWRLEANREEYTQLLIDAMLPTPQHVCLAAVHTENIITLLIGLWRKERDESSRCSLHSTACCLFFYFAKRIAGGGMPFFLPLRQLLSSCIEILGKEFISQSPSQAPLLLKFCLDNSGLVELLTPHFVPNMCPEGFHQMYGMLMAAFQLEDLSFMFTLLSKFNVQRWLCDFKPQTTERKLFLDCVVSALHACGANPPDRVQVIFDVYIDHLRSLLRHEYPANFSAIVLLILDGSSEGSLSTRCWEMVLAECGDGEGPPLAAVDGWMADGSGVVPLSLEEMDHLVSNIGALFTGQRLDSNGVSLYSRWERYIPLLARLLGLISHSYVTKAVNALSCSGQGQQAVLSTVWRVLMGLWHGWLDPFCQANYTSCETSSPEHLNTVFAWTEVEISAADVMVGVFRSSVDSMHCIVSRRCGDHTVLSWLLWHYLTVLSSSCHTPAHVTDLLLANFTLLPWEQMQPDASLLRCMTELKTSGAPSGFQLVGHITTCVDWFASLHGDGGRMVMRGQDCVLPKGEQHRHQPVLYLLVLLVQCHADDTVRQMANTRVVLERCEQFDWSSLSADDYHAACRWFHKDCRQEWALLHRTSLGALGFRLMKAAAEFQTPSCCRWSEDMSDKRHQFVRLLCQCLRPVTSSSSSTHTTAVTTAIVNLMSEIESVVSTVRDAHCRRRESSGMLASVLDILNHTDTTGGQSEQILDTVRQWMASLSADSFLVAPCISAAGATLANNGHLVVIVETCLTLLLSSSRTGSTGHQRQHDDVSGGGFHTETFQLLVDLFSTPRFSEVAVIDEAMRAGSYLLLYSRLLQQRHRCRGSVDERRLMDTILDWTAAASPSLDNEWKLLLWWHQFLQLWLLLLDSFASMPVAAVVGKQFVVQVIRLAESRSTNGFFGLIGFGRSSSLSLKFRLAVRSISAFLSSQILTDETLRLESTLPLSDTVTANCSRSELNGLRGNRQYASLDSLVDSMIGFVSDTGRTAWDVTVIVERLAMSLCPGYSHLVTEIEPHH